MLFVRGSCTGAAIQGSAIFWNTGVLSAVSSMKEERSKVFWKATGFQVWCLIGVMNSSKFKS